jgi:DNA primase
MGERPPRRKRARCSIHGGDSPYSVAPDEERGLFFCHVCHVGGDRLDFIQQALKVDFHGALRWLGIERGQLRQPDPTSVSRQRAIEGLRAWARHVGRSLRDEYYYRSHIESYAKERLSGDHEDTLGWELLAVVYDGLPLDELERWLDLIDIGTDRQRLDAWREWRKTYGES